MLKKKLFTVLASAAICLPLFNLAAGAEVLTVPNTDTQVRGSVDINIGIGNPRPREVIYERQVQRGRYYRPQPKRVVVIERRPVFHPPVVVVQPWNYRYEREHHRVERHRH